MTTQSPQLEERQDAPDAPGAAARRALLAGVPVTDRRIEVAGITTAVLEGGDGPPLVLLHGPGEFAPGWLRVLGDLVEGHRVIAPDLPGHGASTVDRGALDAGRVLAWFDELLTATCQDQPPVVVGRTGGGAIAARFAVDHSDRLDRLVLVDALGLAEFHPTARFELAITRFLAEPSEHAYDRLMAECLFDVDGVRDQLGGAWDPFEAYAVELARMPSVQAAVGVVLGELCVAALPPADLERISVPTTLVWGRHDLATDLTVAEAAAARFGWPLFVIEDAGDDPALDQPQAFVATLREVLA
jgi:pimeloyl-ACP methyl ester carboxylesterase